MISVQRISHSKFCSMEQEWTNLVASSIANPLFMGWAWQYSWWETWSSSLKLELYLLAAYQNNQLVGLLPLYKHSDKARLEFIGNAWRGADTVRTEYCSSIVIKTTSRAEVECAFVSYVKNNSPHHDVILTDLVNPTLIEAFKNNARSALERERALGAKITTSKGTFSGYLTQLSPSVRRKLFNRRKFLNESAEVAQNECTTEPTEVTYFFELLNKFHQARWGKVCFEGPSMSFHLSLINRLNSLPDCHVVLSVLTVDSEPISVVYDIQINRKTYNIQSGYLENFNPKVSLGYLHLGFQIERAYDEQAEKYDFLLGSGKHSFYKSSLTDEIYHQRTYHVIANPIKKAMFSIYFNLPLRSRSAISSLRRFLKF